ncbi:MAG: MBL fold metallo-hydrolase [Candidatus Marinimicrobia bacterium]|jgi:glyoxylase-like metal-dependent hydrolase (beta-lactamase superfamily II)|nr:MBL fold metallo-hydrolase [Candidatus Neomarinimicrobiota bacterium]MDP6789889.1 MBL fold metallo-hydrolase [Candidatus Neomarinimicrobiota bacterium]MDP7072354.1 MBL fold metallo-hydrolase [Candidatus Neomarinimicrobiota bacterium]|tara:strand:+ start:38 stop:703 length:666 start_codon:yes stop_codon:yes gene_type:complete
MTVRTQIETDFSIRSFKGGYDENFTYILTCMRTGSQCIMDAAVPYEQIEPFTTSGLLSLFITHSHHDHTAFLKEYTAHHPDLVVVSHPNCIKQVNANYPQEAVDGGTVTVGQLNVDAIHTPGHNPDSVCYRLENVVFTGDTLFVGRTGRTVNSGADAGTLFQSVYNKLLTLPSETIIYPGHDYGSVPTISVSENIKISPLLQAENEADFISRMAAFEASRD